MVYKPMNEKGGVSYASYTLAKIAFKNGLSLNTRKGRDFRRFFRLRFPHHATNTYVNESYADDWAKRFVKDTEWIMADDESRKALIKINKPKYGAFL